MLLKVLLLTLLTFSSISDDAAREYFKEIAFGSGLGKSDTRIRKWKTNIKISVLGKPSKELREELDRILKDLKPLIYPLKISVARNYERPNYTIYFGAAKNYLQLQPRVKEFIEDNWGLFFTYNRPSGEIYNASMYVDIIRCKNLKAQKHLLREELTQSLGLQNDSLKYSDSIFYENWRPYTTEYSALDKKMIRVLYHKDVKVGTRLSAFFKKHGKLFN